ncbi:carbohydrate kinase [Sulfitobacter sp. SK012]|uniref:carbohydrate kinase family protein n=1 Tax=Sulfitobacter sp. SK012 TaxID=1389005 RepID=UPI000E0B024D|nr:carbohydrate kinase [Sulfitobacter sp. SK012]AXI44700.1 carbohydrate kinase [Sulfitobacter sp. SK012]
MIICCGEAVVDMIPAPTKAGPEGFVPHVGGALYNSAIALARLGQKAGLLTGMSSDMFGVLLRAGLVDSGADTQFLIDTDRPSTLAFVHMVDGHAQYSFFDENSAGGLIAPDDLPSIPDDVTGMLFGGISLCKGLGAETYLGLAKAQAAHRVIMLDPNIRPAFVTDRGAYIARLDTMIRLADIVKISDEDLHWIVPGVAPLEDKARALLTRGPAVVLLSRGGDGATGFTAQYSVDVPAHKVTVADTVGAGDTFNAGVLSQLSNDGLLEKSAIAALPQEALHAAISRGVEAAAVTVSRAGCNPPYARELS